MRTLYVALKDVRIWTRDITALGILLGMPIVLIFILGSALGGGGGENARIKVAIENLDTGVVTPVPGDPPTSSRGITKVYGNELVEAFQDSDRLNDVFEVSYKPLGEENQKVEVASGDISALLVIPADFSERVAAGKPAVLRVFTDPGAQLSGSIFEGVVRSFASQYSSASVAVQTTLEVAKRYNPGLLMRPDSVGALSQAALSAATEGRPAIEVKDAETDVEREMTAIDYYAVSMTAMFLMFGAMFGAFSTIKERREQTLPRLLSTPTGSVAVVAGKMLGIFVLGMLQFTVLYAATRLWFGVDWGSDTAAVFTVAAAEMLAVTGLAALIGAIAKTERGAGGLGPLVIQVQALLGGAFFTISILPVWLQPIRYTSVVGWAMEGWQTVQMRGGGIADVVGPVAALVGFAALFFIASAALTGVRR